MSRRIIFALIAFVVIVGTAFAFTRIKGRPYSYQNDLVISQKQEEKLFLDADNDQLKDWEEQLWKTDPNKADTDGDGTTDFEEIRQGRNPLAKGPNDKLPSEEVQKKINPTLESDLTNTAKFSRELFARYSMARQAGDYTAENYPDFLLQYAQKAESGAITINKEDDFKKIETTPETIRAYGNQLGKIIAENAKKYPGNELVILEDALTNEDSAKLAALEKPIARYKTLREEMLSMSVPGGLISIHAKLTNLFGIMVVGVESMKYVIDDPVKALSGLSMYPSASDFVIRSLQELHDYFINQAVKFGPEENGYKFTKDV